MAKGIIYCMTTIVPGLVKIGKTGENNFEQRMYNLEHNGYNQVVGLKRKVAILVDDYDEKEQLIDEIFSKSRIVGTELFALDINLVIQLLASLDGEVIYPKNHTKEELFDIASGQITKKQVSAPQTPKNPEKQTECEIPNGTYYFARKLKRWDNKVANGVMVVKNGKMYVRKGSDICPLMSSGGSEEAKKLRENAKIANDVLLEDIEVSSPSAAAGIIIGSASNGWADWKTKEGDPIDIFRTKGKQEGK